MRGRKGGAHRSIQKGLRTFSRDRTSEGTEGRERGKN